VVLTAVNELRGFDMKMRMKFGNLHRVGSLAGACGVLGMTLAAQAGSAQQVAKDAPAAAPSVAQVKTFEPAAFGALMPGTAQQASKPQAEEEETAKPTKPGGEGIKVHGHWKIVIKNPDGTVVSSTEFENSLITPGGGDAVLAQLLTSYAVPSFWRIFVSGTLCGTASAPSACQIAPSTDTLGCSLPNCFNNLVTNYIPVGLNNNVPTTAASFQLSGNFTALTTGPLVLVQTGNTLCTNGAPPITSSPSECAVAAGGGGIGGGTGVGGVEFYYFTGTTTAATVTSAGQIVQITVTISFS
jgi:hypothetical protein